MKIPLINSVSALYEIELSAEPNQNFSTTIDSANFDISIQTFADDKTTISISKDGVMVCNNAPITILKANLLFYSNHNTGGFFFASEDDSLREITYKNLGNEVKLYYGYF